MDRDPCTGWKANLRENNVNKYKQVKSWELAIWQFVRTTESSEICKLRVTATYKKERYKYFIFHKL